MRIDNRILFFPRDAVASWSSGTGMAGLAGAFSYAGLTDPRLLGFTSSEAMLMTLIVPLSFCLTWAFSIFLFELKHQILFCAPTT